MERYLLYFADPMCSWCWGFAPVTEKIQETYGDRLPIRLFMGGLRPGNTQPWNDAAKAQTREHWEHVHERSGQPFDFSFFERQGWVYDTDPAARAVVAARRIDETKALDFMRAVHKAFYTESRDVTDTDELVKLAEEFGFDGAEYRAVLEAPETAQETQADYWYSQQAGIQGFPALLAVADQKAAAVTFGYQSWDAIGPALDGWMKSPQP